MTCDKVDVYSWVTQDGEWEILEILGRHSRTYERKRCMNGKKF